MGLRDALQARHYPIPTLAFVNRHGQRESILDIERFRKLLQFRHFNFMRGDLETVLYAYVKDRVPIHFGRSITRICQHPERVEVEFSDSTQQQVFEDRVPSRAAQPAAAADRRA